MERAFERAACLVQTRFHGCLRQIERRAYLIIRQAIPVEQLDDLTLVKGQFANEISHKALQTFQAQMLLGIRLGRLLVIQLVTR